MNVLIIDPASSTGYCLYKFDDSNASANIVDWGFIEVYSETEYDGDRYVEYRNKIKELIINYNVQMVGIEDYFFSKMSPQGSTLNCAYRAMVHLVCREMDIHYDILNISLWKKFINKSSVPSKEQKAKWGKEPAKKLMTQESLWLRWRIKFPNHSLSKKTNKPIKFRYDIVDAVGMAIFHASIYLHAKSISYNVNVDDDYDWKKIPKGTYDYGGNNE